MIKIMLVDDEVFARDTMARLIKRKNFDVVVASTGSECIELFKTEKPQVVFLDVMLPDLDGDHVHNYLKEIDSTAWVYYVTGSGFVFTAENALQAGAKGYLQKPVDIKDLYDILDDIKNNFGEK